MKHCILFISCALVFSATVSVAQTQKLPGTFVGVFDGRTPCQELAHQLNEKASNDCMKIKWRLVLYKTTETSGVYTLKGLVYQRENPRTGNWHIIKGTKSNPHAVVYQLDQQGKEPLLLLKADDNIFFFLDKEENIMVGNRDFSYALNRVNKTL